MIKNAIVLYTIVEKENNGILLTHKGNSLPLCTALKIKQIKKNGIFSVLNYLGFNLSDMTASNHPERFFFNIVYYIYNNLQEKIYLSTSLNKQTIIETASIINFSALVAERECYEMFNILFENHPDLRRLLLDYGTVGNPLLKIFPLSGYNTITFSVRKCLLFKPISFPQIFRKFNYNQSWL